MSARERWQIGQWEIDSRERTIRAAGIVRTLTPRAMDVLGSLARSAGNIVAGSELLEACWPHTVTSPNAVQKVITELRHALGNGDTESYIETVPKRGYRLIAPVAQTDESALRAPCEDANAIAAERRPSVAVLPFANVGDKPENEYLAFGMTEALLDALARVPNIKVASRTNSIQFEPRSARLADIGSALGVDHVLEGSIQIQQGTLRAVAQLIRVRDGLQLFSTKVDRPLDNLLQVQDEIASDVVKHLRVHLDEHERRQMLNWGTLNVDAYLLALEGWYHNRRWSEGDARRAIDLFDRALALDDGLLWAYVGAVDAMNRLHSYVRYAEHTALRARAASYRKRAALHGANAEQLHWMDYVLLLFEGHGHRPSELMLRRRIASTGGSAEELRQYGRLLGGAGLFDEALRYMAPALASPELPWTEIEALNVEAAQHGVRWAIPARREMLARHSHLTGSTTSLAIELALVGEYGEARSYLTRVQEMDTTGALAFSGEAALKLLSGEAPAGSTAFERLLTDPRGTRYVRGELCLMAGDLERGCNYWRKLVGAGLSHATYHHLMSEHYFPDHIVQSDQYQDLLDELGIGRRWTAFLRQCVEELAPVTGIELRSSGNVAAIGSADLIRLGARSAVLVPSRSGSVIAERIVEEIRDQVASHVALATRASVHSIRGPQQTHDNPAKAWGADYAVLNEASNVDDGLRVSSVITAGSLDLPRFRDSAFVRTGDTDSAEQIGVRVGDALAVMLDEQHLRAMREWGTSNIQAYRLACRANEYKVIQTVESNQRAADLFHEAITLDPKMPLAYRCLAQVYWAIAQTPSSTAMREQARQDLRALLRDAKAALVDQDAVDEVEQTYRFLCISSASDAERAWREGLVEDPANVNALRWYARVLMGAKLLAESEAYLMHGISRGGACVDGLRSELMTLPHIRGDLAGYVAMAKEFVDHINPDFTLSLLGMVQALSKLHRFTEAEVYLERLKKTDQVWAHNAEVFLRLHRGDLPLGSEALRAAFADPLTVNTTRGDVSLTLGDIDSGVRYLRETEPEFAPLRWFLTPVAEAYYAPGVVDDPRYQALLEELGIGRSYRQQVRRGAEQLSNLFGIPVTTPPAREDVES